MKRYLYDGPVMEFETCIASHWQASTFAVSKNKAKSNFSYQFKKKNNRIPSAKISLPGKITEA